jgi:hypothetical protein
MCNSAHEQTPLSNGTIDSVLQYREVGRAKDLSAPPCKYTHQDFRLLLVRNLIEEVGKSQNRPTNRLVGRPTSGAKNVLRLKSCHNKHWPAKSSTQLRCHLCPSRGQRKGTVYKCARCDLGLYVVPCYEEYHTKVTS